MERSVDEYLGIYKKWKQYASDKLIVQHNQAAIEYQAGKIRFYDDIISLLEELKLRREIMANVTKAVKQEREKNNGNISR